MAANRSGIDYATMYRDVWDNINTLPQAQRPKAAYAYLSWFLDGVVTNEEKLPREASIMLPCLKTSANVVINAKKGGKASAESGRKRGYFNYETDKASQVSLKKTSKNFQVSGEEPHEVSKYSCEAYQIFVLSLHHNP